jgi:hypothetical protein
VSGIVGEVYYGAAEGNFCFVVVAVVEVGRSRRDETIEPSIPRFHPDVVGEVRPAQGGEHYIIRSEYFPFVCVRPFPFIASKYNSIEIAMESLLPLCSQNGGVFRDRQQKASGGEIDGTKYPTTSPVTIETTSDVLDFLATSWRLPGNCPDFAIFARDEVVEDKASK